MWRVISAVAVVIVLLAWWEYRAYLPKPNPAPIIMTPTEMKSADLDCGLRMAWEDGNSDQERLFALVAGNNLATDMSTGLCDISRKFWTLRAPDNPVFESAYRPTEEADYLKGWSPAQLAQYNKLKQDFQKYREDPKPFLDKFPWLNCVTRYQRTTYRGLYPWRDTSLDKKMQLVHTSPSGAKYFCKKEEDKEKQKKE